MNKGVKTSAKESLKQNYFIVNKKLLKLLGGMEVLFLSYLIDKESYWEANGKLVGEGWFFKRAEELEEELDISESKRVAVHTKLVNLGLIEMKKMGHPYKWYYRIGWEKLGDLLAEDVKSLNQDDEFNDLVNEDNIPSTHDLLGTSTPYFEGYLTPKTLGTRDLEPPKNGVPSTPVLSGTLPKTTAIKLQPPLTPQKAGEGGEGFLREEVAARNNKAQNSPPAVVSKTTPVRPSIDQIRRSWESTFLPENPLPHKDLRLPLLRDLMVTLKQFNYTEDDLPRNFEEIVTAHWWSKAKDKKVKDALREKSVKDYDIALSELSELIEIKTAPKMKNKASNKTKVMHEPGSMSLDAFFDLVDNHGILEETEEFYLHMCKLAGEEP